MIRRASMVLPDPGGPCMSRWWPPAAATSSARLAIGWPLISARSGARSSDIGSTWSCRLDGPQTSPEKVHRVRQAGDPIRGGPGDRCRLTDDGRGDEARHVLPGTQHAGTERVGSRSDSAVERKFADDDSVAEWRDLLAGSKDAQGNREVVVRPSLGKVGRGEVHRDRPIGKADPGRGDRGPNPIFCLSHRGVGETGEFEGLALTSDMGFDTDRSRLSPHEGHRSGCRVHGPNVREAWGRWKGCVPKYATNR